MLPTELPSDVCAITYADRALMEQHIVDTMTIRHTRTAGIKDLPDLHRRVLECVHWNTLNQTPVTIAYLNRLFGRVAFRLGGTVSNVVMALAMEKSVEAFNPRARKVALVASTIWHEVRAAMPAYAEALGRDPLEFETDTLNNWASNIK